MVCNDTMVQAPCQSVCRDCIRILQQAAMLFASESMRKPFFTVFDTNYHSQLTANASSASCHLCSLLYANVPRLSAPLCSDEILVLAVSEATHDPRAATLQLVGFDKGRLHRQLQYGDTLRIQHAAHGSVKTLESSSTWSLETLNCLRDWLLGCVSSHFNCINLKAVRKLPRRLVDVRPTGAGHQPMSAIGQDEFNRLSLDNCHDVRVVSAAKSLRSDTMYLTLSHRWGSPPSILLTAKTSFLLAGDITPYLLKSDDAPVFRHAIHVTRTLGFRYIWIDALCIMQDDHREKTAEIMQMDEIYFNSMLNISAAEGQSSEGLVFARKLSHTNPCRSTVQVPDTQECLDLKVFPERWFLRPGEAPLNNRGWVFQERVLAPRIVQFAKDQVFWECHSLLASEVLAQGLPCARALHSTKGIGLSPDLGDTLQIRSRWYELVEEYSRTIVTFPEDRLLAISAIAKRFCIAMFLDPSDYVAGMWKDDLPLSMLWGQEPQLGRAGPEPTSIGREIKYAPSWSWASILAPIVMLDFEAPFVPSTEVLGLAFARKSPNFFDGTDSCHLHLRGPLTKFCRHLRNGEAWVQIGEDAKFQIFHEFKIEQGSSIIIWWDTVREIVSDEFFLLHIASEHSVDGPIERGVVLCKAMEKGTFYRVGSFMIPFDSAYSVLDLEQAFKSSSHLLDEDDFLERRLSGKCVIDII